MKKIYILVLILLSFGSFNFSYAETEFKIFNNKSSYYQKENIEIGLTIDIPHKPLKQTYYIVNLKTNKKTKLGSFSLESNSQGSTAGLIIDQKPGEYYYLSIIDDGTNKTEYKTDNIIILNKNKIPKIKIQDFSVDVKAIPYFEQTNEREYIVTFSSPSEIKLSDVWGKLKVKCSSPVKFYEKGAATTCSKKQTSLLINGTNLNYSFAIDEDDLEKDVKMTVEYSLENTFGKVLDRVKQKVVLSNEI